MATPAIAYLAWAYVEAANFAIRYGDATKCVGWVER